MSSGNCSNKYKCNTTTISPYVILSVRPPPQNYIITLIKPFSFVWYVIPQLKRGVWASTRDLFLWFWQWKHRKEMLQPCTFNVIGHNTIRLWCLVASSKALGHLHWAMRAVMYHCTTMAIKTPSPIPASRGFWSSPGNATLGNALCIALADCHGHWNGQRSMNMLMPFLILSSKITVA